TSPDGFRRPDPKTLRTNGIECGDDHAFVAAESGPPNDFFILGIHFPSDAELDRAADCQQENLGRGSEGLQKCRDDDVGVDNNADHVPGCGLASRRAFRAAAISASISSVESWSNPVSLAVAHDWRSHSGARSCSKTCRAYCSWVIPCAVALAFRAATSSSGSFIVKFMGIFSRLTRDRKYTRYGNVSPFLPHRVVATRLAPRCIGVRYAWNASALSTGMSAYAPHGPTSNLQIWIDGKGATVARETRGGEGEPPSVFR